MITESCITGCNLVQFVFCAFLAVLAVWLSLIAVRGSESRSERILTLTM